MYYVPYYMNIPMYSYGNQPAYWAFPNELAQTDFYGDGSQLLTDYGAQPLVIDMETATERNNTYRTALWTGEKLQVTLMSLNVGEDVGLEIHPDVDQFLYIEQGRGVVQMGKTKDQLNFQKNVQDDFAIMIPAGTWHNLTNTGNTPLKLYSIYAPPNHPFGTVHATKADAMAAEEGYGH